MTPLFIKAIAAPEAYTPTVKVAEPKAEKKEKEAESTAKAPDIGHFKDLMGLLSTHKTGGDFGPDSVEAGHHVAFKAGDYTGSGKVCTTGRDGLSVMDSGKREHRVHWREVTGHFAPEKDDLEPIGTSSNASSKAKPKKKADAK